MTDRNKLLEGIDKQKALFGTFFAFGNLLQTVGDKFYEEITCKQFFLLICLSLFNEAPPTMNELAQVMGTSHQNVRQLAGKLEKNGFIKICQDQQDRRKLRVMPTDKMAVLAQKYGAAEVKFFQDFFAGVSAEEVEQVYRILITMEQNLKRIEKEIE